MRTDSHTNLRFLQRVACDGLMVADLRGAYLYLSFGVDVIHLLVANL